MKSSELLQDIADLHELDAENLEPLGEPVMRADGLSFAAVRVNPEQAVIIAYKADLDTTTSRFEADEILAAGGNNFDAGVLRVMQAHFTATPEQLKNHRVAPAFRFD